MVTKYFLSMLGSMFVDNGEKSWLTVGDAYGADANYILSKNTGSSGSYRFESRYPFYCTQRKIYYEYRSENAEKLSIEDNHFDYIVCKESYHHFPRPYMVLYEMLMVCKKGVVIIEPQDPISQMPLLLGLSNFFPTLGLNLIDKISKNRFSYERVGNFVYKVSQREFEKVAAGLALPMIAVKKINPNFYF